MQITILTLFPEMFTGPLDHSIVQRARDKRLANINYINIRDFATDKHKSVDDHPFGGGTGMLLRVDIVDAAIQSVLKNNATTRKKTRVILLDPQGTQYDQPKAKKLSVYKHLVFICGHYEGVDERIRTLVDEQISIGDYILSGGELAAMVITDSIVRLLPGTLKKPDATAYETFSFSSDAAETLLEYPQYTKPPEYKDMQVPEVLLSGNHKRIEEWKKQKARERTKKLRPDLLIKQSF